MSALQTASTHDAGNAPLWTGEPGLRRNPANWPRPGAAQYPDRIEDEERLTGRLLKPDPLEFLRTSHIHQHYLAIRTNPRNLGQMLDFMMKSRKISETNHVVSMLAWMVFDIVTFEDRAPTAIREMIYGHRHSQEQRVEIPMR